MAALPEPTLTPEQYLAFERASDVRHEYLDGQARVVERASRTHILIVVNLIAALNLQLRKRPCEVYAVEMRVRVSRKGLYTYPDGSVVCGTPQFEDNHTDTLLNPTVIIEVLSSSTEYYDRGKKAENYRAIPSLQDYVLVKQDAYGIEHYARQNNWQWLFTDISGPDGIAELWSIECRLSVADLYDKVTIAQE